MSKVRDERADRIRAMTEEYQVYRDAGMHAMADRVLAEIRAFEAGGSKVEPDKKERAVSPEPVERTVEVEDDDAVNADLVKTTRKPKTTVRNRRSV